MTAPAILCFAGSTRKASYNRQLIKVAAKQIDAAGGKATLIELADFPLPMFNEDLEKEEGLPKALLELKKLFKQHEGLLISCPEYNSSLPALLKNTIDWLSRKAESDDGVPLASFKNKSAGLIAASPGALGGLRCLFHVREILQNIGVLVHPDMFALSSANQAFDEAGNLKDQKSLDRVAGVAKNLTTLVESRTAMARR